MILSLQLYQNRINLMRLTSFNIKLMMNIYIWKRLDRFIDLIWNKNNGTQSENDIHLILQKIGIRPSRLKTTFSLMEVTEQETHFTCSTFLQENGSNLITCQKKESTQRFITLKKMPIHTSLVEWTTMVKTSQPKFLNGTSRI